MRAKLPFQSMSSGSWINLALAAIGVFYAVQVALDVLWGNTCGHLGTDYCAFWSAGRVANEYGYAKVYDLDLLGRVQFNNFPSFGDPATFAVSPFAYLPLFLLPFQLFALIPTTPGFWIWTLINVLAFTLYLRFFNKKMLYVPLPRRLLLMLFLSLPVYWNLLDGQVNVWLMICLGEFMRLTMTDKPMQAGLWLGGLLLKPQTLLLLAPILLFRGAKKAIAGLAISAAPLAAASIALVGMDGVGAMLQVWLGFSRGMPTNDVDSMMNWRMIAFHLSNWISPGLGLGVAVVGILLTLAAAIYIWRKPVDMHSPTFVGILLGTLAATGLVAWHSHIHMAMIMIPPLVLLGPRDAFAEKHVLEKWVLIPVAAYVAVYVLAVLIKLQALPGEWASSINVVRGGAEFGLNAWLLGLAVSRSRQDLSF